MSSTDKLIKSFLLKLHTEEVSETFELLSIIVEQLENKDDPELFEVQLFNAASELIEKINLIHGLIKDHGTGKLTGNKLQGLYDKHSTDVGSQVLFD